MNDYTLIVEAQKYRQILERFDKKTFSWVQAVHIVGGRARLLRLIEEQKVSYTKPLGAKNTAWQFNARDILMNVKPNVKNSKNAYIEKP